MRKEKLDASVLNESWVSGLHKGGLRIFLANSSHVADGLHAHKPDHVIDGQNREKSVGAEKNRLTVNGGLHDGHEANASARASQPQQRKMVIPTLQWLTPKDHGDGSNLRLWTLKQYAAAQEHPSSREEV